MSVDYLSSDTGEIVHKYKFITVISEAFAFLPTFTCFLQILGVLQEKHPENDTVISHGILQK